MARKEMRYLVLDCETATLPFASELANGDAEKEEKDCYCPSFDL